MVDDSPQQRRTCATMTLHHRLLDTSPPYVEARDRIEDQAYRFEHGARFAERPGCTEIPVVVHVVWNADEHNISREQIDSQIEVLNQDFRMLNADITDVPAAFAARAADARIRFALADTDPDGEPTDGVVRVHSDSTDFDSSDEIKSDAAGGSSPWPTDRYLNIWVGRLRGGLLGYAQFPGGPATTDGVVVTTTAFGTTGTATAPFDRGRTATHEVGHWLNLRHIWGDDGDGCSGSDFVADTPNQGGPNYGTPSFPTLSCNNAPDGDMFMNYLDYVDDAAMSMFTHGQVVRMQATLTGPRIGLGRSVECESPTTSVE